MRDLPDPWALDEGATGRLRPRMTRSEDPAEVVGVRRVEDEARAFASAGWEQGVPRLRPVRGSATAWPVGERLAARVSGLLGGH